MDRNSSTVVAFNKSPQLKIDLNSIIRSLSILSWDLQVQQVITFADLAVNDSLLNETVALNPSSKPHELGHENLREFVTRSQEENGLGLKWDDFYPKMTALVYRNKYAMHERDHQEINALVEDASKILGHRPIDVAEYHAAKERALQLQIQTLQRDMGNRISDLQDKQANLVRSLTERNDEVVRLQESSKSLLQETSDRIEKMSQEISRAQDKANQKAEIRIKEEAQRIEKAFNEQLQVHQSAFASQLRDAEQKRGLIQAQLQELEAKINRGEYVPASELQAMQSKIDEAWQNEEKLRQQMLTLNDALTEAEKKSQALLDENNELRANSEALTQTIAEMEARIQSIIDDKSETVRFALLHYKVNHLSDEKEALQGQLSQVSVELKDIRGEYYKLRHRSVEMRERGRAYCNRLKEDLETKEAETARLSKRYLTAKMIIVSIALCALAVLVYGNS